jgi:hypothetical protein
VRFIQEVSLSDQIKIGFSPGTSPADIDDRRMDKTEAGFLTRSVNYWIAGGSFAVMAGLYLLQRVMIRRRQKQKNGEEL